MHMAFYGVLRPGGTHHHEVRSIPGTWQRGMVAGWVYELTWGPAEGYLGITLDPTAPPTEVDVLESDVLSEQLDRLDRFEGPGYVRRRTEVTLDDGRVVTAEIYEADPEA